MSTMQVDPNAPGAVTPAPEPAPTGGGGTQTPEGFVPKADFDTAEAQRRSFQSELDRVKAENEALRTAGKPAPVTPVAPEAAPAAVDLEAFRRQILTDVLSANSLKDEAASLKAEYPHADPALFAPASLAAFASSDALRIAAMDSHARVDEAIKAAVKAREDAWRQGGDQGSDPQRRLPGGPEGLQGDPTPAQLNAMSSEQWEELESKFPGVIDRVLRSAN